MGASVFSLVSTLGDKVTRMNLRETSKYDLGKVAGVVCEIHGIRAKEPRAPKRRPVVAPSRHRVARPSYATPSVAGAM